MKSAFFAILAIAWVGTHRLPAAPQTDPAPDLVASLADGSWIGSKVNRAKGNSPAQLKFLQQNGNWMAFLACDGYEETLTVTVSAPSTIQLKGVSFKDIKSSGRTIPLDFALDTFTAEFPQQGQALSLAGVDTRGARSRYEFRRANSK